LIKLNGKSTFGRIYFHFRHRVHNEHLGLPISLKSLV
jgi:hypothetical protein